MGLSRMLSDAPHLQCLREQLSACRQLALRAIWSLQCQDASLQHVLLHDMVRDFRPRRCITGTCDQLLRCMLAVWHVCS